MDRKHHDEDSIWKRENDEAGLDQRRDPLRDRLIVENEDEENGATVSSRRAKEPRAKSDDSGTTTRP
jgi:hypothetical protein